MSNSVNRPYIVEQRCGMPVYIEARTLPELPQKEFDNENPTVPPIVEGSKAISDELQALVIGDSLILDLGSMEAYVEIGLMLKDASPFRHTFVVAYSNGPWLGYLPSPHGFAVKDPDAEGEARTHFSSDAPHVLIAESLKLVDEMGHKDSVTQ